MKPFDDIASSIATLAMKTTYWDGTLTVSRTVSREVGVKSVEPGEDVAVDGERKATVVLTVQPVGGGALSSAQIPAGTAGSSSN